MEARETLLIGHRGSEVARMTNDGRARDAQLRSGHAFKGESGHVIKHTTETGNKSKLSG